MPSHLYAQRCKYHRPFTCQPSLVAKVNFFQPPDRNNFRLGSFKSSWCHLVTVRRLN